ncbi:hypothetical protein D0865_12405 [Hortaea werneckii]|uniref:Cytochrome b-c1 complex subunit 10 n=1 Tax=Hortaea werneckii TaxID=91943 RepID=A0A3M7BML5_HORWE|nr:hypothetical protein D0865_12405 [Hortaea werneckii]
MRQSLMRMAQYGLEREGTKGVTPWRQRVKDYRSFKSSYGPDLTLAGGFGGVAGIFALFFFNGIPKVQQDILQKVPFIGDFFKHEVAPEDNPF